MLKLVDNISIFGVELLFHVAFYQLLSPFLINVNEKYTSKKLLKDLFLGSFFKNPYCSNDTKTHLHATLVVFTSSYQMFIVSFCLRTAYISRWLFQRNFLDYYRKNDYGIYVKGKTKFVCF